MATQNIKPSPVIGSVDESKSEENWYCDMFLAEVNMKYSEMLFFKAFPCLAETAR